VDPTTQSHSDLDNTFDLGEVINTPTVDDNDDDYVDVNLTSDQDLINHINEQLKGVENEVKDSSISTPVTSNLDDTTMFTGPVSNVVKEDETTPVNNLLTNTNQSLFDQDDNADHLTKSINDVLGNVDDKVDSFDTLNEDITDVPNKKKGFSIDYIINIALIIMIIVIFYLLYQSFR